MQKTKKFEQITNRLSGVWQSDATLPLFLKIMQSLILMQNPKKKDSVGGGKIFGSPFFFPKKLPFLANTGRCPNFLGHALT